MALVGSESVIETRTSGRGQTAMAHVLLSQPCTPPPSKLIARRQRGLGRGSFREGVEVQGQSVCVSELKYVLIPHMRAYYVIDGMKARNNFFSTNFCCRLGWIGKTLQSMYTRVTFIVRH